MSQPKFDGSELYENERRLAAHSPYAQDANPPQYGIQMGAPVQGTTVVVMGEQPWVWNWCTLVTSVIAFFLCPICGFTGTVFGLLSYTDHKHQHYNDARSKKNMALCCGITGIVLAAIIFIICIALIANGVAIVEKAVQQSHHNFN